MIKFFAIFVLVITLLRLEFVFRFKVSINVYGGVAGITLYLFSLRVFEARIIHESNDHGSGIFHLQVFKKQIEINIFSRESQKKILNPQPLAITKDILSELRITELATTAKIGDRNALRATMIMGSAKILYCSFLSFLKNQRELKSYESFLPYYNEDMLTMDIEGILKISFADIISIFIIAVSRHRHRKRIKLLEIQNQAILVEREIEKI